MNHNVPECLFVEVEVVGHQIFRDADSIFCIIDI